MVKMAEAEFVYSFEYHGNAPRLVYTPLSDKCYLVLTQGLHLGYGGNVFGPAGTGKTETIKALGQYLGRQVVSLFFVFVKERCFVFFLLE